MVICNFLPSKDNQVHWHAETNYGHPLPLPSRDNQVCWHVEINYGHLPLFEDSNVFRSRLLKYPLPSRDNQVCWHTETNYGHLHLCLPETIKSVGIQRQIRVICLLSRTSMSLVIECFQLATMFSFTFWRQQCLQSLHAFKRRQCLHLHFEGDNVLSHCILSKGDNVFSHCMLSKGDNIFIYISKTKMSSVIACFQKVTMSSFTFWRW